MRKPIWGRGFLPRHRGFPLARCYLRESKRKPDLRRLVLCSLGAEVREAETPRGFRVWNGNFHEFQFPFRPLQSGLNL